MRLGFRFCENDILDPGHISRRSLGWDIYCIFCLGMAYFSKPAAHAANTYVTAYYHTKKQNKMQIDEPAIPNCLKILVIQDCSDLENAIWNMSKLRSVDLLTQYYGPQFNEMSIDYKPLYLMEPLSVCGQYVAIIIDFACLPEIELEQKRAISELGVMLNPNCPESLILISGVDHQNKQTKLMNLLSTIANFALESEIVEGGIMIVYCVSVRGTMYTRGFGAELKMHDIEWRQQRNARDTTNNRIKGGRYDKNELKSYLKQAILFKSNESNGDRLFGTLDVLAFPTRADFSADWEELHEYDNNKDTEQPFFQFKSRHPFYILNAAPPNVADKKSLEEPPDINAFRSNKRQFEAEKYLDHYKRTMENVFNAAHFLGIQHLILHPFGMGSFIRNLHEWVAGDWRESGEQKHNGGEQKYNLRLSMVTAMVEALDTRPRPFLCHMCYPVHKKDSPGNKNNQQAIQAAMTGHNNIILQPGVDALALANHVASMGLSEGISVGMLNSADANRMGTHWEDGMDENIHRRSHMLCLTHKALNGYREALQQNVIQNGGVVYVATSEHKYRRIDP